MSGRAVSYADWIDAALRSHALDLHVSLPAEVQSFDAGAGTVDVQPLTKRPRIAPTGEVTGELLPILQSVPVWFPGAGGHRITFPIAKGDLCWVVFGDFALDVVRSSGKPADPVAVRNHHLTDGVALFGVRPGWQPWTAPDDGMTLGQDGGPQIKITGTSIELGGTAHSAALGDVVYQWMNDVSTWLSTLILPSAAGPAGPPANPPPVVPDVRSTLVTIEE